MKKMILSAAAFAVVAVSAVAVAPTTSEAIPAFARQTGAACLSCHHLSFPALSAFGRSFKAGSFTDVGEQALIEDDHLSITSSVNLTLVLRPNFVSTTTTAAGVSTTSKTADIPTDPAIIFGGRVGTNTGVFVEFFANDTTGGGNAFANFKLTHSMDVGGGKAGISIFSSGFGESYGYETGSTYGQHGGMLGGKGLTAGAATKSSTGGVALFYGNELVNASLSFVTSGLVSGRDTFGSGIDTGWKLAPSARVFVTPEIAGMSAGLGILVTSGNTGNANTTLALGLPGTSVKMKRWVIDGQLQGEIGDVGIGFYADYANAAASTLTQTNLFNGLLVANKGYSARVEVKPTHNIIVGGGIGNMKAGTTKTTQWQVGAEYEVYQNFVLALIYNNTKVDTAGVATTTKTTTIDIEALL
ncbi:hypothetical protein MMIC_P1029 [Mariprofundus micogutta]|uniref:Uncharacterized protein n=1 Tax=Mariprofundus micogutta TaxID=1921010 RepID=A0A1L8CMD0_9PROT|nr:hypothetical protein [Mariprofundus micogutta]GAV20067.1 hypothetical protein MMIC_P1029 [Mariprofundus micogutta]